MGPGGEAATEQVGDGETGGQADQQDEHQHPERVAGDQHLLADHARAGGHDDGGGDGDDDQRGEHRTLTQQAK